jgi:Zn-dependent peptidase ImmA (M78 family)
MSWDDEPLPGALDDFSFSASRGVGRLKPYEVVDPLYEVAREATDQLLEWRPESSRFQRLAERFEALQSLVHKEQRVAWLAGLRAWLPQGQAEAPADVDAEGPLEVVVETQSAWQRVEQGLRSFGNERAAEAALAVEATPLVVMGSCQAALLFGAVSPTVDESDVMALAETLIKQYDDEGRAIEHLVSIDIPPTLVSAPAYQQGYDLAEQLHDDLDIAHDWVDVEGFLDRLGVQVLQRPLSDRRIRGVSFASPQHIPTIVVNPDSVYGKSTGSIRFTLAHELCHLLFDREVGQRLAIASGPWAPKDIERRANAFAAMFLMPPYLVAHAIAYASDPIQTLPGIEAIAGRLRVGVGAAIQHLYNLTLMDESERDGLLRQLGSVPSDLVG